MKFDKIHVIINPAAGNEEPILSYLNNAFQNTFTDWDVSITKAEGDATTVARSLLGRVDIIAVYGGDGSVAEVAKALIGSTTPMAIIPGGTANVLSKELGIPQDPKAAIELLTSGHCKVVTMDAATANDELFLIRVNLGVMANMILEASRELKDKVGQLAYGITAVKTLIQSERVLYRLLIDGVEVNSEGVALTVTNCGSIGIGDYSFLPDIKTNDEKLDVILMRKANLLSVLRVAGSTLMQTNSDVLLHWQCQEIEIGSEQTQSYILDDCERTSNTIKIRILPAALNIIVPDLK